MTSRGRTDRAPRPSPDARPSGVVTLLTDFGLSDPFVGVMTGALLRHFPEAKVVQLTHGIAAQATDEAAFWLERCYCWFAPGTVHVAVVDPDVGTERAILAARLDGHAFVVPDAGLLGPRLLSTPGAHVVAVDWPKLGLPTPSRTFHGRDLFAPIAARLANGAATVEQLGPAWTPRPAELPGPERRDDALVGRVAVVDRFGNLLSNLDQDDARGGARVHVAGRSLPVSETYAAVAPGELVAVVNSFGVIEVAVRNGNAADRLGAKKGDAVSVVLESPPREREPQ